MKSLFLGISAAMTLAMFAPFAIAQDTDDVPTVVVDYSDLNINTQDGVHELYSRLRRASVAVCGYIDRRDIVRATKVKECRGLALDRAVSWVDSPALAALHARSGKTQVAS